MLCTGLYILAHIAQQVEHFLGKEEVTGSSPVMSSSSRDSDYLRFVLMLLLDVAGIRKRVVLGQ